MRPAVHANVTRLATITALAVLLVFAAGAIPAVAKEGMLARLDAPIALGAEPGTELLVGITVTVPDAGVDRPVEGSPIQLVLTGRDGSTTRAAGAVDGTPGHYVVRVTVPAGGVRRAEVVMHGTSDLPIVLAEDPFAFGPVTARTAQVAPPLAPAPTPFPRASTALVVPIEDAQAADAQATLVPAAEPRADAESAGPSTILIAFAVALAVALGLGVLVTMIAARRPRGSAEPAPLDGAPGA
jgi:hypothetical protein